MAVRSAHFSLSDENNHRRPTPTSPPRKQALARGGQMSRLAVAGIHLPGLSISALGDRFVAYLAFDNADAAALALRLLANLAD
jgi:hypothetical protein